MILHNDDYTTMEFVVQVLEDDLHKAPPEAYRIMMQVHLRGRGVCGAYPYEMAETKVEAGPRLGAGARATRCGRRMEEA